MLLTVRSRPLSSISLTGLTRRNFSALFSSGTHFAQHFTTLFHPIGNEYDLLSKHPDAAHTINNVDSYQSTMDELRSTIAPELELIESRVVGPVKELQGIMKMIRKMITKRDHKVCHADDSSHRHGSTSRGQRCSRFFRGFS